MQMQDYSQTQVNILLLGYQIKPVSVTSSFTFVVKEDQVVAKAT